MNVERLRKLADLVEKTPHFTKRELPWDRNIDQSYVDFVFSITGFNMDRYSTIRECGTSGCLAGLTVMHFGTRDKMLHGVFRTAQEILDLDWYEAEALFHPYCRKRWNEITPQEAAQACRLLAELGNTDNLRLISNYIWKGV